LDFKIIKFGDVFKHKEKDYVYLAKTDEVVYAVQILDSEISQNIFQMSEREARKGRGMDNILYCFVLLDTAEFKGRMAHFANSAKDHDISFDIYSRLDDEDIQKLKDEILSRDTLVPMGLIELIKQIKF